MNEAQLELSVMELFQAEGYEYISGDSVLRETTDVLLKDDLQAYLLAKYATDGITQSEVESIIFSLVRASHDPLYDANREMLTKIREGFVFRRDDKTKKDLFAVFILVGDVISQSTHTTIHHIFRINIWRVCNYNIKSVLKLRMKTLTKTMRFPLSPTGNATMIATTGGRKTIPTIPTTFTTALLLVFFFSL